MSSAALRPGLRRGAYPERATARHRGLDALALQLASRLPSISTHPRQLRRVARRVASLAAALGVASESDLAERVSRLRGDLAAAPEQEGHAITCFALASEFARRRLGMPPYEVQLMAGWALAAGRLAEMATGEGKTLTATLPACAAALAGIPVHVVTANDYLVARDAEQMRPIYEAMGLRVGAVQASDTDPARRRAAYACDVTYVSGKQLGFDYLRDRMALAAGGARPVAGGRLEAAALERAGTVMRGLCFAIVDEADHTWIDEARTPLVISGGRSGRAEPTFARRCREALACAEGLQPGLDYRLDPREGTVHLTESGRRRAASVGADPVRQAIAAHSLYHRDHHYLVREGRVEIVDPHTGRCMPDRAWEAGLHQMIEAKEGCAVTGPGSTAARISFQQLFRRYLRLAGMTGTAREVAPELARTYGIRTVRIPTRLPSARRDHGERVVRDASQRWAAVVDRVREIHADGRPVLVGTHSVAASEALAARLADAGLPHALLNARQDRREAEVIARAGERGRITVATGMAGRGADIPLGPGVAALGGLHVLAVGRGEARRIDRQLFGRCARQGEPGSTERVVCLDDELLARELPAAVLGAVRALRGGPLLALAGRALARLAQRGCEGRHARIRRELASFEGELDRQLGFAGPRE